MKSLMKNKNGYKVYKNLINSESSIKLFKSFLKVLKFCGIGKILKVLVKLKIGKVPSFIKN